MDDAVHQVRLRNGIFAVCHLLQYPGQDRLFVDLHVHPLELAEAHQIRAHKNSQILALLLPALFVFDWTLVLHPHPQSVSFREVLNDEIKRVLHGPAPILAVRRVDVRKLVPSHVRKVVAEKEAPHGMLHPLGHLH